MAIFGLRAAPARFDPALQLGEPFPPDARNDPAAITTWLRRWEGATAADEQQIARVHRLLARARMRVQEAQARMPAADADFLTGQAEDLAQGIFIVYGAVGVPSNLQTAGERAWWRWRKAQDELTEARAAVTRIECWRPGSPFDEQLSDNLPFWETRRAETEAFAMACARRLAQVQGQE